MKVDATPICNDCRYRTFECRAQTNRDNIGRERIGYTCRHRDAEQADLDWRNETNASKSRMLAFIGFSQLGSDLLKLKTHPKWCPLMRGERHE